MLADTLNDKNLQKVNYILQTQNGLSDVRTFGRFANFFFLGWGLVEGIGMQRG